jgi:hypothetical protein
MQSNPDFSRSRPSLVSPLASDDDDAPATIRVLPAASEDGDDAERALLEAIRAKYIEILQLRRQLAERVRRRQAF